MNSKIIRSITKGLTAEVKDNHFRATATIYGVPDRGGDVIYPGAVSKQVANVWKAEGWLDIAHSWNGDPVGMPSGWDDADNSLILDCEFHTDEESQKARTKTKERLDAGKKVSVSIGFMPDYSQVKWYASGDKLLEDAKEAGYDLALFDTKAIKKLGYCRSIPVISELFELSICNVGMHRGAQAIAVKGMVNGEDLDEWPYLKDLLSGGGPGLPLIEHLSIALGAVRRSSEVKELRETNGGQLGDEAMAMLLSMQAEIDSLLKASADVETPAEQPGADHGGALRELEIFGLTQ
ncbi:MAG: hypothetical protein JST51_01520 [Armatimonadetes bacterium]|nr:hypothetical protein [Armatimonadota bacterium]